MAWDEPYLETCCRSALHRLLLSAPAGRPAATKDDACLARLTTMRLAVQDPDGRYRVTEAGVARHAGEVAGHRRA